MPENPNDLHVVGVAGGRVWHTIRSPGGQWTALRDVLVASVIFFGEPTAGHVVDVACARRMGVPGLEDGLWVLVAFDDRAPHMVFRGADTGRWQYVGNGVLTSLVAGRKVAIGTVHTRPVPDDPSSDYEVLHAAVVNDDGHEYLAFGDAEGDFPGGLVNPDELHGFGPVSAIALDSMFVVGTDPVEAPLLVVFDQRLADGTKAPIADSLGLMRYTLLSPSTRSGPTTNPTRCDSSPGN